MNSGRDQFFRLWVVGSSVTACSILQTAAANSITLQRVAVTGMQAPGTTGGIKYQEFGMPVINDSGQVAFAAALMGGNVVHGVNGATMYAGSFNSPQLIARDGNAAPGTGASFRNIELEAPSFNDAGQVAFGSALQGLGVIFGTNEYASFAGGAGSLQLVARQGNAVPGAGTGATYLRNFAPALADSGRVAFLGAMSYTGPSGWQRLWL